MSLARLTQLFLEGTELVLTPPSSPESPIVVWVAKLNSFEEEQANLAGRVARARIVNALKEVGSDEYELMRASKSEQLESALVFSIVRSKETELFMRANADQRSDPAWREKLEIIDHTDAERLTGIEAEAHEKLVTEQTTALLNLHDQYMSDYKATIEALNRDELEDLYEESFLAEQGMGAFGLERAKQHIYLCMRICEATVPEPGRSWDHSRCDHQQRFLADVDEVKQLPQSIRDKVEEAYTSIAVPPTVARFTDARASSSGSPEPSATEEASTLSGPGATSPAQGTTSS